MFLFRIPSFNITYSPAGNRYWHGTTSPIGKEIVSSVAFFLIHSKCKWNGSTANNWLFAFGSALPFHAELLDAHLSYGNQGNCTREAPFSYKPSSFPSVTRITKGESLSNFVLPLCSGTTSAAWLLYKSGATWYRIHMMKRASERGKAWPAHRLVWSWHGRKSGVWDAEQRGGPPVLLLRRQWQHRFHLLQWGAHGWA